MKFVSQGGEDAGQSRLQFWPLLTTLVLVLGVRPFLHGPAGRFGSAVLLAAMLLAAVFAVYQHRAVRVAMGLAAPAVLLIAAGELIDSAAPWRSTCCSGSCSGWATSCSTSSSPERSRPQGRRSRGKTAT